MKPVINAADINSALQKATEQATDTYRSIYGIPKTSPNVMRFTHYLDLGALGEEIEVAVEGRYTEAYPGNHEEPGEDASFEIERVTMRGDYDICDLLTGEAQDEIIKAAMEGSW